MRITLLGTGDTTGTPTIGCTCETCNRARELGVERSRFSVHIEHPRTGEAILIDASPDFRQQFLTNDVSLPDAVIITHTHFDHLDGLGNTYRLRRDLPVYASDQVDDSVGESVAATVRRRYEYLRAVTVHGAHPFEAIRTCGFRVTLIPVVHPPMASYGVVIEEPETGSRLGLTGDTNADISPASKACFEGVDLLLADAIVPAAFCENHPADGDHYHDGIPYTFGKKHMTREGALALADELSVSDVRLVHASHFYPASEAFEEPLAIDGETHVI